MASAAGKAAVARAQSRVTLLTILDNLMRRTHLMPSLSEAFDEAFTTFAVRLSLIAFGLLLWWADQQGGRRELEELGAGDAVKVDSTVLSLDQVIGLIVRVAGERGFPLAGRPARTG